MGAYNPMMTGMFNPMMNPFAMGMGGGMNGINQPSVIGMNSMLQP